NPFHIDIQKDQVIIYARIQQCFPAGITVDLKQRFKFFQIFFHLLQHTFLIITDSYFHFFCSLSALSIYRRKILYNPFCIRDSFSAQRTEKAAPFAQAAFSYLSFISGIVPAVSPSASDEVPPP